MILRIYRISVYSIILEINKEIKFTHIAVRVYFFSLQDIMLCHNSTMWLNIWVGKLINLLCQCGEINVCGFFENEWVNEFRLVKQRRHPVVLRYLENYLLSVNNAALFTSVLTYSKNVQTVCSNMLNVDNETKKPETLQYNMLFVNYNYSRKCNVQ